MSEHFSQSVRFWLENRLLFPQPACSTLTTDQRDILHSANNQFNQEFAAILENARRLLERKGWKTRLVLKPSEPYFHIQVCRPEWPSSEGGVHYEARLTNEFLVRGAVDLNLHIEGEVPNAGFVRSRIRELLRRHERHVLATCGARLCEESEAILQGELPLASLTSNSLAEAIETAARTESFVDEALFLGGRTTLWRTDFLPNQPEPVIDVKTSWAQGNSERGGWKPAGHGGRLDSLCLELHPGRDHNFRENMNILMLSDELFEGFGNGESVYGSAVVNCPAGIELTLTLQTDRGHGLATAFQETKYLAPCDRWQVIRWEGQIKKSKKHEFAEEGLFAYLIADRLDGPVKIDSIEVGRGMTHDPHAESA